MRLIFMGTPEFSVTVLKSLIEAGHQICAVYSQPPRKSGRGMKLRPSPVQAYGESQNIPVLTPISLKDSQSQAEFANFKADAAVVVAYGQLLPQAVLDAPDRGCFNVHASLLPRWRGAAPIQRAIMAGDQQSGVTIMQMEAGLDTGPMCLSATTSVNDQTTANELHDILAIQGAELMVTVLEQLQAGTLTTTPQPTAGVTYAKKIDKAEARINFDQSASQVQRHIHGLSPFPGSWFELPIDGQLQRIKILACQIIEQSGPAAQVLSADLTIACATGSIRPIRLQRPGKDAMTLSDFLNGTTIFPGTKV